MMKSSHKGSSKNQVKLKAVEVKHSNKYHHDTHDQGPVAKTNVSDAEVSSLLFMIEEEKMARDIYDSLFEQTGLIQFDRISDSEQNHYDTLLATADKLGIDTSALSTESGVFTNVEVQNLYDQLIAQGSVSIDAAIDVGIAIETTDIADLYSAIESSEISLLGGVYGNLLDASYSHLTAFENIA
jgi:hypothetical protein